LPKHRVFLLIAVVVVLIVTGLSFAGLRLAHHKAMDDSGLNKAELIYERGTAYFKAAEVNKAENAFLMIISKYPSSDYAEDSLRNMAKIYTSSEEYDKAAYYYKRLLKEFPNIKDAAQIKATIENLNIKQMSSSIRTEDSVEYAVQPGDSLYVIAKKFNTTVPLIKKINNLKSDMIRVDQKLKINVAKFSIYVDKAKNILILKKDGEPFKTYTVATGENNSTPVGVFAIVDKMVKPPWTKPGVGVIMPEDERYELGERWLPISAPGYGIHGTNDDSSIGKQSTSGCVRMYDQDVVELYDIVPTGTEVEIVDTARQVQPAAPVKEETIVASE
jgi:lipoprotein-anchoring transpeptidase ErfK/SrfK